MDKTNKIVHMANGEKMIIPKPAQYFTLTEKHHIIQEYLIRSSNKNQLWKKYTGKTDHGRLLNWMRKLGYDQAIKQEKAKFVDKQSPMLPDKELPSEQSLRGKQAIAQQQEAKIRTLEKELKLAKKELELAQIKAIAYSTMIDLAEKEFNISIRKK